MTYQEYKNLKQKINKQLDKLHEELNSYERNYFGLATKETKKLKGYKSCKMLFNIKFKQLQELNRIGAKLFRNEIRNDYKNRFNKN